MANFDDEKFHLTVADNGNGFNFSTVHGEGSGLHNMQSRSKLIDAEWKLESAAGKGTQIHLMISTNQKHDNYSPGR